MSSQSKKAILYANQCMYFSKSWIQNWQLQKNLEAFDKLGLPLLIGASRKRFLGKMLTEDPADPVEPRQRDHATAAITAQVADQGVWAVRVHSIIPNVDAVKTIAAGRATQ